MVSERGGYLGELGYWATSSTVGDVGTGILVAAGLIAAVILISGASLGHMVRRGGQGAAVASRAVGQGVSTATVTAIRGSQSFRERLDLVGAPDASGGPPPPGPLGAAPGRRRHLPGHLPRRGRRCPRRPPSARPATTQPGDGPAASPAAVAAAAAAPEAEEDEAEIAAVFTPRPPSRGRDGSYRLPRATILRRSSGPATQPAELVRAHQPHPRGDAGPLRHRRHAWPTRSAARG